MIPSSRNIYPYLSMALTKMDPLPETMDFLSLTWCNFAVQAFEQQIQDRSIVLQESMTTTFDNDVKLPSVTKIDDGEKFVPPWKTNDVKSWIWMQQAMHPELNYSSYFKRNWMPWKKIAPLKHISIKKWLKENKQRRKEDKRIQKAEVHAAISVAGVAAALAAIAAENSQNEDSAVASAAALVAAQCAKVAEAMGATREQLSSMISSAISSTSASEIVTLTAAAATSIRGSDTLKARSEYKNRLNGISPVLPLEDNHELDFNFEKCRPILAKGAELKIEKMDGSCLTRLVKIILHNEAKVIFKIKKSNMLNAFTRQKESMVLDMHAEMYRDKEAGETETGYLIVLTTNKGIVKLDMGNNYQCYRTWSMTINHMLMLSTTYELQFYKNLKNE